MRVQEALSSERPEAKRVLTAFKDCGDAFSPRLPESPSGRASVSGSFLLIDRSDTTLPVELPLGWRAGRGGDSAGPDPSVGASHPAMEDPASEAEAVVLIDEIELHLHPAWQRRIVHNLTAAFPRCQFIATTHSPQVIGEVEHNRIQIIAMARSTRPPHSLGVDSSRVLEEIMDANPRTREVQALLSQVSQEVDKQRQERARGLLSQLVARARRG